MIGVEIISWCLYLGVCLSDYRVKSYYVAANIPNKQIQFVSTQKLSLVAKSYCDYSFSEFKSDLQKEEKKDFFFIIIILYQKSCFQLLLPSITWLISPFA